MVKKMQTGWYPWLNLVYKNIINNYQKNKLHHTIIIESYNINNTYKIIWAISKWILCNQKNGIKYCGKCTGCSLIKNKNHPDFYIFLPNKKNNILEIEKIKNILNNIQNTAQQNNNKILWIPNYNLLTIFGINILLKIIEEPPKNTFFFIGNNYNKKIEMTFKSRCLLYRIPKPSEKIGLLWIKKKNNFKTKNCLIALQIHNYDPELAYIALNKKNWNKRINFYKNINISININNFLILLPKINTDNIFIKIYWIILLLMDGLKYKKKLFFHLINIDQIDLIKKISKKYSYIHLNNILKSWIKCRYQLINIKNINFELLILKQLFKWKILNS